MFNKIKIQNSYTEIIKNINSKARILAVSKNQSIEKIEYLSKLGQLDFGENYLQDLRINANKLPYLKWHFIGSIQSRKIKHIVKYSTSIQSVEKLEQLEKINRIAKNFSKIIDIFLQINIDNDINKSGFKTNQLEEIIENIIKSKSFTNLKIIGLMCVTKKLNTPKKSFIKMKLFFDTINSYLDDTSKLSRLSMGMSADYKLALECGSTDVRIGSNLFGKRDIDIK